jgi:hypothetical protein
MAKSSNEFDFNTLFQIIYDFDRKTHLFNRLFPVIRLTRVTVISRAFSIHTIIEKWRRLKNWLFADEISSGYTESISDILPADVLIVYSSVKPSWYPALEDLGAMLLESNVTCCILAEDTIKTIYVNNNQELKTECRSFSSLMKSGGTASERKRVVAISLLICIIMSICFATSSYAKYLLKRLPLFFFEFIDSYKRLRLSNLIVSQLNPKVVITNGEHLAVCSEIMYVANVRKIHGIWFYNEWPHSGFVPSLSKEVWTWNEISKEAIQKVLAYRNDIVIRISGRAETDYNIHIYPDSNIDEEIGWIRDSASPMVLFLLDYNGNPERKNASIAHKSLEIISKTAKIFENWIFIVKPRPFQYGMKIPGEKMIEGISNCRILRKKCSIAPLLALDCTRVVVGCQSSGLLSAAGQEKIAVRLLIPGADMSLPYIDTVCIPIRTVKDLSELLKKVTEGNIKNINSADVKYFPYRGNVVERMRDMVLEKL